MGNTNYKDALSKEKILTSLADFSPDDKNYDLTVLKTTASTSDYLIDSFDKDPQEKKYIVAEEQTNGRGTNDKSWSSPAMTGIWLSFTWQLEKIETMLSACVAIAVKNAISKYLEVDKLLFKWPNDIYYKKKKLGGILIETYGNESSKANFVIGIGINVFKYKHPTTNETISLDYTTTKKLDRNIITAELIYKLEEELQNILEPKNNIVSTWNMNDIFYDRIISVKVGQEIYTGKNLGINDTGALQIQLKDRIMSIHSGKITTEL